MATKMFQSLRSPTIRYLTPTKKIKKAAKKKKNC